MYHKHRGSHLNQNTKVMSTKPSNKNEERNRNVMSKSDVLKYISDTQFHGAKMLADGETRWYWVPAMLVLFICGSIVIYLTTKRFQGNPTFMIIRESSKTMLSFPSVSICPEIIFSKSKQDEFLLTTSYPEDLNETYISTVLYQLGTFYAPDVRYKMQDLENLEKFLKHNNIDVLTASRRLTTTCEETLLRCQFDNVYYNCSHIFRMEMTGDGFCCVFNGRSLIREMKEQGQEIIAKKKPKWYTRKTGFGSGLMIAIDQSQELSDVDLTYKWITLQGAQNFVDTSSNGTALNPGTEQWMIYRLRSFHIADDAKILRVALRKCDLAEQGLTYFPVYRRKYCILECEMELTIKTCNCVRVVHPKPPGIPYCEAKDHLCSLDARVSSSDRCECRPTCSRESNTMSKTNFALDSSVRSVNRFYKGLNLEKVTVVRVFIQTNERKVYERESYFSFLELFSQLGGMVNVFFGGSILTTLALLLLSWKIFVSGWTIFSENLSKKNRVMHYKPAANSIKFK